MNKKIFNFAEAKAEKDGTITPLAVIESVARYMLNNENSEIEKLAIVVVDKNGTINTAQSTMSYLELVGLHATAQATAIEEMDVEI